MRKRLWLALAAAIIAAGIGADIAHHQTAHPSPPSTATTDSSPSPPTATQTSTSPPPASPAAQPAPTSCHAVMAGALPDPRCTPGAVNKLATQSTLKSTVCKRGWSTSQRPPLSYTEPLKRRQIRLYGYADTKLGDYEEDHLVPLELGGAPADPANLWPEPHVVGATAGSYSKDRVENRLHADVCAGRMTLHQAQLIIATDWLEAP